MHPRRFAQAVVAAMVAVATLGVSGAIGAPARQGDLGRGSGGPPPVAVPAAGTFYPVLTHRVLGDSAGSPYAIASGASVSVKPVGAPGVPSSGVSAAMVNVTVTAGAADVALAVGPTGAAVAAPLVSAPAGTTRSVLLTVPLGGSGTFDVTATSGSASVAADLVGFYAADDTVIGSRGLSGGYQPVSVTRVFDTDGRAALAAGARQVVSVDLGASADTHATALLVRATAKNATAAGALTVTGAGTAASLASSAVSFAAGSAISNLALVPVSGGDHLDLAVTNASTGATGVTLDVVGFYDDGALGPNLRYRPLPQTTVVDTRAGQGPATLQPGRAASTSLDSRVAGDSTFGLVGVVTAAPAAASDVAVDGADPTADSATHSTTDPSADPATHTTTAAPVSLPVGPSSAAVQTEVGAARTVGLRAKGTQPVDVRLEVTGSFEAFPAVTNPAARGWVSPVPGWQISAVAR